MADRINIIQTGFVQMERIVSEVKRIAADEEGKDYWVGTGVPYARFLEFGARGRPARTFMGPAMFRVRRRLVAERGRKRVVRTTPTGRRLWQMWFPDGVTKEVADLVVIEAKKIIEEKNIIDTGRLLGSIKSAPTEAEVTTEDAPRLR